MKKNKSLMPDFTFLQNFGVHKTDCDCMFQCPVNIQGLGPLT